MNRYITITEEKIFYILLYFINFTSLFNRCSFRAELKYAAILFCGIYIFNNFRYVLVNINKRDYSFFIYLGIVILSSLINNDMVSWSRPFLASILFAVVLLEDLFAFIIIRSSNKMDEFLNTWFLLVLCISLLSGLSIPFGNISKGTGFLLGDKFNMAYHQARLVLLAFLVIKENDKNREIKLAVIYSFALAVSIIVGCGTGVFELVLFLVFIRMKKYKTMANPTVQIGVLLVAASFVLINAYILNNNFIMYVIVNIFKKEPTLTGRTLIYGNVIPLMLEKLLIGYGYGTNYEVCMIGIGAVNAQNGLVKVIMESGIFSVLFLLLYMFFVFTNYKKRQDNMFIYPALCFMLGLSVISAIEITIDSEFIMWLLFLRTFIGDELMEENIE